MLNRVKRDPPFTKYFRPMFYFIWMIHIYANSLFASSIVQEEISRGVLISKIVKLLKEIDFMVNTRYFKIIPDEFFEPYNGFFTVKIPLPSEVYSHYHASQEASSMSFYKTKLIPFNISELSSLLEVLRKDQKGKFIEYLREPTPSLAAYKIQYAFSIIRDLALLYPEITLQDVSDWLEEYRSLIQIL
jgi:hypothetical protein